VKTFLITILTLTFPLFLKAAETTPANTPREIKTETREIRIFDLQDIRLDMSDGSVSFLVKDTTYTYQPNLDSGTHVASQSEKIAVGATFLSELRHASKVIVSVEVPSSDHIYTPFMTLQADVIK